MKVLILGANGATGKQVVKQLLLNNQSVKIIVRPMANIEDDWLSDQLITIIKANISELTLEKAISYISDCQAVVFCLGHSMSIKGIYGTPHMLVTDAVKLFCKAIENSSFKSVYKIILMNTAGYRNIDENEQISFCQNILMYMIRKLLPPHLDNENAAEYLRATIGQDSSKIQWVVVRPDNLVNSENVSNYETVRSPTSTLFKPSQVSRINVSHFMATLILSKNLWNQWKGKMPVIYNIMNP